MLETIVIDQLEKGSKIEWTSNEITKILAEMMYMEGWNKCSYNFPRNRKISSLSLVYKRVWSDMWKHDTNHSEIGQVGGSILIQGLAR